MAVFDKFTDILLKDIIGVSYIGKPKNHTMMYMTKKIENRIVGLSDAEGCLVFLEDNIDVPADLVDKHFFLMCKDPAGAYTEVARKLEVQIEKSLRAKHYTLTGEGYYIGEDVQIGKNPNIEPMVFIDHGVKIGDNVVIKTGVKIRYNSVIGNNCSFGENTVIGEPGFNSATVDNGDFVIMPAFGKTIIGNNVYFGANVSVSKGSADDTKIKNFVKIDSNVRIGHDVILGEYCEVRAKACVAGYAEIGCHTKIGAGANIKNRISVGDNCFIGMGCYLNRNLKANSTVTGNPAITLEKYGEKRALDAMMKKIIRDMREG